MRKILLALLLFFIIIILGNIVKNNIKKDLNDNEREKIVAGYMNDNYTSIKGMDSDTYISNCPNFYSILDYEIIYNDDTCLMLVFLEHDVQIDTINYFNNLFAEFILMGANPIGDPNIIDVDLRENLHNKVFRAYIGNRLAIDYKFYQEKYTILSKELNEDVEKIYKQRKVTDEFGDYIKRYFTSQKLNLESIEKSFNNRFLLIKTSEGNIDTIRKFISSSEFNDKIMSSKHDFIEEVWIIQSSLNNKTTKLRLDK